MRDSCEKHPWIERATRSLEHTANCNQPDDTIPTHEAVFEKAPFAIPADQAGVNLEDLE